MTRIRFLTKSIHEPSEKNFMSLSIIVFEIEGGGVKICPAPDLIGCELGPDL